MSEHNDIWNTYKALYTVNGTTNRERALNINKSHISSKAQDSLSCHEVLIDGVSQKVTILNKREDVSLKKICALPGDSLPHGGIVDFADGKWLITELDSNDELYASGLMKRCNYLLKWLDIDGNIIERWCVVEDGTKYLIGEKTKEFVTIGDARIAITLGKDSETNKLSRGKRFLVDDLDTDCPLAYQITKTNKLFSVFNGRGVFRFICNEVNLTDDDNVSLRIADYYNWKPYVRKDNEHRDKLATIDEIVEISKYDEPDNTSKGVWL